MSLVEMILNQKLILLSIGLAIAPLLAAATLILVSRLRQNAARRAWARRAQAAARQAAIASIQQQEVASPEPAAPIQVESTPATAAQSDDIPVKTSPVGPEPPQEQPPEDTPEQAAAESPEMQDILSSIFADDDASSHYGALLESLDEVDTAELVTMCNQIAHQIRAGSAPAAQD